MLPQKLRGTGIYMPWWLVLASHVNVLRGSSRGGGRLRDEPLRTFAWEARLVPKEGELSPIRKIIAKIIVTRSGSCCHLQSAITTSIRSSATNNHMEINSENF